MSKVTLQELGLGADDLAAIGKLSEKGLSPDEIADAVKKIHDVSSSANEIDGNYNKLHFKIKEADRIIYCGDSISYGVGVVDPINVSTFNIKEYIRKINNIKSIGFQTILNTFSHYHHPVKNNIGNWLDNYSNRKSINGFSYDTSVVNEFLTIYCPILYQTKAQIYFTTPDVNSTVEVYLNNVLTETITFLTTDTSNIKLSSVLSFPSTGTNTIKLVLTSGKMSVSGVSYTAASDIKLMDLHVTGGRRISHINNEIISYYNNYDLMFFALSYNDVVGGTTEENKLLVGEIITSIAEHYIANNKTFVYINFCWSVGDFENWVLTKLNELFTGYENYFYLDYKSTIKDNTGAIASSAYRQDILKEWGDGAHPNDLGHIRYTRYFFYKALGRKDYEIPKNVSIVYENYSLYNAKNYIGKNVYGSIVYGVDNKVHDSGQFVTLIGIGNETNSNNTYAIGEYNTFATTHGFVLGIRNGLTRIYSAVLGSYAKALNSGLTVGYSKTANFFRQLNKQVRSTNTTNTTESFTRDTDNHAFLYTNINTKTIVKGSVYAFDLTSNIKSVFKLDCVINNVNNITTLSENIGTTSGIITLDNPLNVSCSVRASTSNNNTYSIRVIGNNNRLNWIADVETIEVSVD